MATNLVQNQISPLIQWGTKNPTQPLPVHLIQVHLHLSHPQALLVNLLLVQSRLVHQRIRPVKPLQ